MSIWTNERIAELRRLWELCLSAAQIAVAIGGVSRNAVIGKIHRLGLSGRVKVPAARRAVGAASATVVTAWGDLTDAQAAAPPAEVIPLDLIATRTIMTIREGECRAIIGDPAADEPAMCGREAVPGAHAYCEHHRARFLTNRRNPDVEAYLAIKDVFATRGQLARKLDWQKRRA